MKTIPASEFKEKCLAILDNIDPEGIVITKRGKPVGRLVPVHHEESFADLIGSIPGLIADPTDDLFSTGAWISDEWGDLNPRD
jgi:prevent-host-death family protein